jgi:hypothetical protein
MRKFLRAFVFGTLIFMIFRAIVLVQAGKSFTESVTGALLVPISLVTALLRVTLQPSLASSFFSSIWDFLKQMFAHPFSISSSAFWDWFDKLTNIGENMDQTPTKLSSPTGGETPPPIHEVTSKSSWGNV